MGCFLACFGGADERKRRRRATTTLPPSSRIQERYASLRVSPPKQLNLEVAHDSVPHLSLRDNPEQDEQLRENPLKQIPSLEVDDSVGEPSLREDESEKDRQLSESPLKQLPDDSDTEKVKSIEKVEQEGSTGSRKKVTFDLNVTTYVEAPAREELKSSQEEDEAEQAIKEAKKRQKNDGEAYPLNHRYQNCASSDDEDAIDEEEDEYDDCDFDVDDEDEVGIEGNEEESYESFFSLPLEKEQNSLAEVNSPQPIILAKGSSRDRSQYVHSVLNPVENLTRWKQVKDRAPLPRDSMKENISSEVAEAKGTFSSEPTFKNRTPTKPTNPIDTSLSSWLVSPEHSAMEVTPGSNSIRSNSSMSREERPILGALTVEDIKHSSATSSPRKSPSRSPDDIPIVGTVGGYWSSNKGGDSSSSASSYWRSSPDTKGIPNTTSKYREDKKVNWHSTPFEVRLERALKEGSTAAEACPSFPPAVC